MAHKKEKNHEKQTDKNIRQITAAKKKSDRADAEKLADLLGVNLLPECTMMSEELRELRRILRYRNMVVRISSKMKNKISGLLMEVSIVHLDLL